MAENETAEKREETEGEGQEQLELKADENVSEDTQPDTKAEEKPADESEQKSDEEEIYVFGDQEEAEENPEQDSSTIRKMRETIRKQKKIIKQFEGQQKTQQDTAAPGQKPTLQSCDMDDALFERKLLDWKEKKDAYEKSQEEAKKREEEVQQQWQQKVSSYTEKRDSFGKDDFEDKESVVVDILGDRRAAGIIDVCDNADKMIYALGSNPEKLNQLAKLDEARYLYTLGQLSREMKTITRKPTTRPEKIIKGDMPVSSSVDQEHERLLSDAHKTGDMKKLLAYRSRLRAEGKPLPNIKR